MRYLTDSANGEMIRGGFNSYERNNADAVAVGPAGNAKTQILSSKYNPRFTAEFDITVTLSLFTEAAGVYTVTNNAGLNAALRTKLGAFIFGQSDYAAGYAKAISQFPVTGGWVADPPFVFGKQVNPAGFYSVYDATVTGLLTLGALVIPYHATVGGVHYVALASVQSENVAYGTMLDSTVSDRFIMNMIRYILDDTTATGLSQFGQKITWFNQTLFGKFDSDTATPNSYKMPENQQEGIIDIPLLQVITKDTFLGTYILTTTASIKWSIFVQEIKKAGQAGPLS